MSALTRCLAGRDPFHIRMLTNRQQGFLRIPAGFQEAWKVGPDYQLWNTQIDLTYTRLPASIPVPIPVIRPDRCPFMFLSTDKLLRFQLHQHLTHYSHALSQKILVLVHSHLAKVFHQCYSWVGHRVSPFLFWFQIPSRKHTMTILSIPFYTTI
jgi:hypothetical protein